MHSHQYVVIIIFLYLNVSTFSSPQTFKVIFIYSIMYIPSVHC